MRAFLPLLAIGLLHSGAVRAADDVERVRALAGEGKHAEAATELGGLLAKAQKKDDLLEEQRLWIVGREALKEADARTAWAALLPMLDPKRSGAFVSAHLLAERLVFACVENGDRTHLEAATAVLEARGKAKGGGRHAALVLRLARAVAADGAGAAEVCEEAAKEGWAELAGHAATATFQGSAAADGDARRAEEAVVQVMLAQRDPGLAMAWAQPIKARLQGNAAAVSAVTRVMSETGAITVQMLGTNDGTAGGGTTELEKAWKRLGKRPIATLARTGGDLLLEQPFERFKRARKPEPGVKVHAHGGVHLALNRFGVAVRLLDVGKAGAVGDDAEVPGTFDLIHRVGSGETWTLSKRGVQIR